MWWRNDNFTAFSSEGNVFIVYGKMYQLLSSSDFMLPQDKKRGHNGEKDLKSWEKQIEMEDGMCDLQMA